MNSKPVRLPSPEHPITLELNPRRVLVRYGHLIIADTYNALTMREANYPPVHYVPAMDVVQILLTRSERQTYCPFKGDCSYYSIQSGNEIAQDAVWTYEAPYDAVSAIKDHYAFYRDRVEITEGN